MSGVGHRYVVLDVAISSGTADVWSCGIILYAMLAGYLPFENYLAIHTSKNGHPRYKSIITVTPFFPDWISTDARDLLETILVPDPTSHPDIDNIAHHRWLSDYASPPRTDGHPNVFGKTVGDLEHMALQNQQRRRSEYKYLAATITTKHQHTINFNKPLPALPPPAMTAASALVKPQKLRKPQLSLPTMTAAPTILEPQNLCKPTPTPPTQVHLEEISHSNNKRRSSIELLTPLFFSRVYCSKRHEGRKSGVGEIET